MLIVENVAPIVHFTDLVSIVDSQLSIHSDHFHLHFYNIRQCQLTISDVTMVIRGPTVLMNVLWVPASPNYIWFQWFRDGAHLQINANGNKLLQNWNCPIFSQVMFYSIFITREKMWIKNGFCGERHQKEQTCRVKPHGTPNMAWAKSPSKCYNFQLISLTTKETSKVRITGPLWGEPPIQKTFPYHVITSLFYYSFVFIVLMPHAILCNKSSHYIKGGQ